jgi:hypothetical protein
MNPVLFIVAFLISLLFFIFILSGRYLFFCYINYSSKIIIIFSFVIFVFNLSILDLLSLDCDYLCVLLLELLLHSNQLIHFILKFIRLISFISLTSFILRQYLRLTQLHYIFLIRYFFYSIDSFLRNRQSDFLFYFDLY